MKPLKINHAAVWVSIILLTGLGFVWYGALFGDKWMAIVGIDMATMEANPPSASLWISNTIATIIPVYVLAWLFIKLDVRSAMDGAMKGLIIGFSFVFLSELTANLFAGNPYALTWINGGFNMTGLTMCGLILGAWRKEG